MNNGHLIDEEHIIKPKLLAPNTRASAIFIMYIQKPNILLIVYEYSVSKLME